MASRLGGSGLVTCPRGRTTCSKNFGTPVEAQIIAHRQLEVQHLGLHRVVLNLDLELDTSTIRVGRVVAVLVVPLAGQRHHQRTLQIDVPLVQDRKVFGCRGDVGEFAECVYL